MKDRSNLTLFKRKRVITHIKIKKRPPRHTDLTRIVNSPKYEFGCAIVARADVGNIRFTLNQDFGAKKAQRIGRRQGTSKKLLLAIGLFVSKNGNRRANLKLNNE